MAPVDPGVLLDLIANDSQVLVVAGAVVYHRHIRRRWPAGRSWSAVPPGHPTRRVRSRGNLRL